MIGDRWTGPIALVPGCVHQLDRVLQHRHHPEAEQIDFDDPHVGAVVLVPLDDDPAGHARVFERHDAVEAPLADHHAAGVLPEVPRQILNALPQIGEQPERGMIDVAAGIRHAAAERVGGIDELELIHHLRQPIDLRRIDAERLPHFARGALPRYVMTLAVMAAPSRPYFS